MLRKVILLIGLAVATVAVACTDNLDAGKSCPLLCPEQSITLSDTTVDAVVTDTTVMGLPAIGLENYLMLSTHGDTLETRAIIRFDTLQQTFSNGGIDSTVAEVDSAYLVTPLLIDSLRPFKSPVTIEAYDVDTTATDTVTSIIAGLFRPDRFLGSKTFAPESLLDTIHVPISTDTVLDRVLKGTHLRVGLRLISPAGADLQLGTTALSNAVTLQFKSSKDTAALPVDVAPLSETPTDQPFLSGPLADYSIVLRGQTTTPPTLLSVGGVPSKRIFLHFDVPSHIVDSTTVVRASLLLTQTPNRHVDAIDSMFVYPVAVLSGPVVTDIGSALEFLGPNGQFGLDSLFLAPGDSGVRSFEIVGLVRTWRGALTTVSPRTLAIKSGSEGQLPGQIDFFSTKAAIVALRPRLRITYAKQTNYGLPR